MVKIRWWSLFIFLDSFMFNVKNLCYIRDCPKHPNVPPELYNLTDLLIGNLECAREVAQSIMKTRFGDSTHITKFREGHSCQPCGYTQVCYVRFVLGALV